MPAMSSTGSRARVPSRTTTIRPPCSTTYRASGSAGRTATSTGASRPSVMTSSASVGGGPVGVPGSLVGSGVTVRVRRGCRRGRRRGAGRRAGGRGRGGGDRLAAGSRHGDHRRDAQGEPGPARPGVARGRTHGPRVAGFARIGPRSPTPRGYAARREGAGSCCIDSSPAQAPSPTWPTGPSGSSCGRRARGSVTRGPDRRSWRPSCSSRRPVSCWSASSPCRPVACARSGAGEVPDDDSLGGRVHATVDGGLLSSYVETYLDTDGDGTQDDDETGDDWAYWLVDRTTPRGGHRPVAGRTLGASSPARSAGRSSRTPGTSARPRSSPTSCRPWA